MICSTKWVRYTVLSGMFMLTAAWSLLGQEEQFDVAEELNLADLFNMKITVASKTEENVSDAPGVISVVTQDELKRFGGTTLGDIIGRVPSFLQTTTYLTDRAGIAARGDLAAAVPSSHILLLFNGRPVREVQEGGLKSEMYKAFPISVIDHIEIIRGPGSVLYGSQAFSAVINVVTKSPENNTVSVSGALGEGMANNVSADLQYKLGNFGIVLAGRYSDLGLWKTPYETFGLGPHMYDVEIPDYGPGFFGQLSYRDDKFLNFTYNASYCNWTGRFFIPDLQSFIDMVPGMPNNVSSNQTSDKFFNDIGYSLELSDTYSLNANFTYTRSTALTPDNQRNSYEMTGELTNFFTPVDNFNILLGGVWGSLSASEKDRMTKQVYNEDNSQKTFSEYLQADYRWEWLKIIGGVQANKVAEFEADYNPRGGLIIYPLENINIKALYSTAYRAPSLTELYLNHPYMKGKTFGVIDPNWTGDKTDKPSLDPEKVRTFDVGVNFQDEKAQFGVNGFRSQMKNLIFQNTSGKYLSPTYDNIGKVTIFGLEAEGKYYLTTALLFEASFLYQQSKDDITNEDNIAPLPNFSAKGGLSYQSEFGLTVSAFNTFRQALDAKFGSTLNKTTGYFNMTDVHCSYDLNKLFKLSASKEISLVLNIDNLLDEEIWLPAWGMKPGSTIPYNEGRTIYGGFRVAF